MQDVPYGYCQCGCGEKTRVPPYSNRTKGWVGGVPMRFAPLHGRHPVPRPQESDYVAADRGYETPCWIWRLRVDSSTGYGRIAVRGTWRFAHRWYYEAFVGPATDLDVDHLCRVPACVNPAHLEAVSHAENIRRGAGTKLTREAVAEIRASHATLREIAERFGVSASHVSRIRSGKKWTADMGATEQVA